MKTAFLSIVALAAIVITPGCAPEPRSVACSNDAQCEDADERFQFCLESRCVECVGITSCPDGQSCDSGVCVECVSDQECSGGRACVDGACKAR
jgi:peptidoglycan-associated lipoprotein